MLEQAILIGLAAWRITALIAYERGPADVFLRLRARLGFEHDDAGEPTMIPDRWFIIGCPWCLGVWTAGAVYCLWLLEARAVMVIAAAAVVIIVERWVHR